MINNEAKRKSEREINAIKADITYLQDELGKGYSRLATFVALQPYVEQMNEQLITVLKSLAELLSSPQGITESTRLSMLSWITTILEEYGVNVDLTAPTEKCEAVYGQR